MSRLCPDDKTALSQRSIHGVDVDVCPTCGGIWLDRGEIARVRALDGDQVKDFDTTSLDRQRVRPHQPSCPICGKPLEPFKYAGNATLETCPDLDGIWMPESELDKIAAIKDPPLDVKLLAQEVEYQSQRRVSKMERVSDVLYAMRRRGGWPWFRPRNPNDIYH